MFLLFVKDYFFIIFFTTERIPCQIEKWDIRGGRKPP